MMQGSGYAGKGGPAPTSIDPRMRCEEGPHHVGGDDVGVVAAGKGVPRDVVAGPAMCTVQNGIELDGGSLGARMIRVDDDVPVRRDGTRGWRRVAVIGVEPEADRVPDRHDVVGSVGLGAAAVRYVLVLHSMKVNHGHGMRRRCDAQRVASVVNHSDRARGNANCSELVGQRGRETICHDAAIGMAGCVYAAAVYAIPVLEQVDYPAHEPDVVTFGRAVYRGVPVAGIAQGLRVDRDETLGVCLVAHAGVLLEVLGALTMPVQHYDEWRSAYGVVVCRYVQQVRAQLSRDVHPLFGGNARRFAADVVACARLHCEQGECCREKNCWKKCDAIDQHLDSISTSHCFRSRKRERYAPFDWMRVCGEQCDGGVCAVRTVGVPAVFHRKCVTRLDGEGLHRLSEDSSGARAPDRLAGGIKNGDVMRARIGEAQLDRLLGVVGYTQREIDT